MRQLRWTAPALLFCLALGSSTVCADGDEKVKFADLPKAVKKTIKAKYPDAEIKGASKEKDDDEVTYEVEMMIDGKGVDVVLDDEGEIEAIERTIEVADLPSTVVKAAQAKFRNARIDKVEEITDEDDVVVYELTITVKGKPTEVIMSPSGKLLEDDDDDDDDEKEKGKGDDKKGAKEKRGKKDKDDEASNR